MKKSGLVTFGVTMTTLILCSCGEDRRCEDVNGNVVAGLGLVLLPVARLATDKLLLAGGSLTRELVGQEVPNVGAGVLEGAIYVCISFLIGSCF